MANIKCERIDCFVSIRLECGETNVLTMDVLREFSEGIRDAETHGRGLLLCGGDKFFSNGVDLEWTLSRSSAQIRAMFFKLGQCILQNMGCPLPVAGAIKGHAIGGAMALLLACDYRYGATGRVLVAN